MDYRRQQRDPTRHLIGIATVVLVHVVVIYAMMTGLVRTAVDIVKKPVRSGGNSSGTGAWGEGAILIEEWANVTVRYVVTTRNYSQTFETLSESHEYPVNGTTEIKFDVDIEPMKPIDSRSTR